MKQNKTEPNAVPMLKSASESLNFSGRKDPVRTTLEQVSGRDIGDT